MRDGSHLHVNLNRIRRQRSDAEKWLLNAFILLPPPPPSSVEPKVQKLIMTTVNMNSNQAGSFGAGTARPVPFLLRLRESKPARPLPAPSLRVPVTPANRDNLRALRQSEMEAWLAKPGRKPGVRPSARSLRSEDRRQNGPRLLPVVAGIALIAIAVGMLVSPRVPERLTEMVSLVRAFLVQF